MADIEVGYLGTETVPKLVKEYVDFGDGTHGEKIAAVIVGTDGAAQSYLPTGTDRSGAITTGGTAQTLAASNTSRRGLSGQNISVADLWINEIGGTAAADTAGSYRIPAGATFEISTSRAVSIVGATTGQKFTATEW